MKAGALLLDLDGTVVDSLADLTDAVNAMLSGCGKSSLSAPDVRRLVGRGARNLVQSALGTESPDKIESGLRLFMEYNAAHIADKSRLYPGTREALEKLGTSGVLLAVISNKHEALCRKILDALGIAHFFKVICGGDTFPEMKPSPLPLLRVVGCLGIPPDGAVMAGDSINDIQAGKQAGIITIGCSWGYGGAGELAGADHLAGSFCELAEIILAG